MKSVLKKNLNETFTVVITLLNVSKTPQSVAKVNDRYNNHGSDQHCDICSGESVRAWGLVSEDGVGAVVRLDEQVNVGIYKQIVKNHKDKAVMKFFQAESTAMRPQGHHICVLFHRKDCLHITVYKKYFKLRTKGHLQISSVEDYHNLLIDTHIIDFR